MNAYMIFLGGTGARCMEAFIYSVMAGCSGSQTPENIHILSADPDNANGNRRNAENGCKNFYDFFHKYHASVNNNGSRLAKPNLHFYSWNINQGNVNSLTNLTEDDNNDSKLLKNALYSSDLQGLPTNDAGYKANPNLGAAMLQIAMLALPKNDGYYRFIDAIANDENKTNNGGQIRLMVVGSIFGGTGASSFPTIISDIHTRLEMKYKWNNEHFSHLSMGAVMVGAYFTYPWNADNNTVPDPATFPFATKQALTYYSNHTIEHLNAIYLFGSAYLETIDQKPAGGDKQTNPPMLLELDVAMACHHFFSLEDPHTQNQQVYYKCIDVDDSEPHNQKPVHGWNQLKAGDVSSAPIAQMLYFCFYMQYRFIPDMFNWNENHNGPNYFTNFAMEHLENNTETLTILKQATLGFLKWFADMLGPKQFGQNITINFEQTFVNNENSFFDNLMMQLPPTERVTVRTSLEKHPENLFDRDNNPGCTPQTPTTIDRSLNQLPSNKMLADQKFHMLLHKAYASCCTTSNARR